MIMLSTIVGGLLYYTVIILIEAAKKMLSYEIAQADKTIKSMFESGNKGGKAWQKPPKKYYEIQIRCK
jgi:hypothetical protein